MEIAKPEQADSRRRCPLVQDYDRLCNSPELSLAVAEASQSGFLHAGFSCLEDSMALGLLLSSPSLKNLTRLDLSHNQLESLPSQIGNLTKLEQLWVNNNKTLKVLPDELAQCKRLKLIDARETGLVKLPATLGTLDSIFCIDLRDVTTLKEKVRNVYFSEEEDLKPEEPQDDGNSPTLNLQLVRTARLMKYLKRRFDTKRLKHQLEERFKEGHFRELSDSAEGIEAIRALIKIVFREFKDLDDIKDVIRNCERLFPEQIEQANVPNIRRKFIRLKRQNERKKLAAKLELKLRAVYFDRIDPSKVEGMVKSIYAEIEELEDIQFLINYATKIFPEHAEDIDAKQVFEKLKEIKQKLAQQRAEAIATVVMALQALYPHVEPVNIEKLSQSVCKFFGRIEDLKKLAADAALYFPAEYEVGISNPISIRHAFMET